MVLKLVLTSTNKITTGFGIYLVYFLLIQPKVSVNTQPEWSHDASFSKTVLKARCRLDRNNKANTFTIFHRGTRHLSAI